MNVKDSTMVGSPLTVKNKPKKRSLIERELETSLTERVTSPVTHDGGSTSRYGRTRRLKTNTDFCDTEKAVSKALKSPVVESSPMKSHSPVYKMHASNSPVKMETPKKAISVGNNLESQIEHIYHENISLSRFGSEEKVKNVSQTKNFSKVYVRKDLIQRTEKEETASIMKNMFSPTKSNQKTNSHLNNILERSSEKYSLNINGTNTSKQKNGYLDTSSVVKTLDFDNGKKKKKDGPKIHLTKSEIFEMEAKCVYQVGDLTWARVGTYPFWPCIVTREPLSGLFVRKKLFGRVEHDIIHVTFFGDNGRRGWIVDNMLRKYLGVLEFENTKENFTVEDKKKDPKLYAAFFVSEKKLPLWNVSVEEAETLLREPKRLRIDIFNDLLEKSRSKAAKRASIKMSRTNSDVSLSESLFDTLFSEDDGKTEDQERSRSRSKNKSLDVSEVVTACLDNMAAKTGITKIQRQSHMDRWLQKAKSKTPEKAQPKLSNQVNKKFEKDIKTVSSKKKKKPSPKTSQTQIHYSFRKLNSQNNLTSFQNEHDYTFPNARRLDNATDRYKTVGSNIDFSGSGIGFISKVETLAGKENDIFCNNSNGAEALVNEDCVIEQPHSIVEEIITDDYEVPDGVNGEIENKELNQHNSVIRLPEVIIGSKVTKPRDRLRLNRTKKLKDNKVNSSSLDVNNGNKEIKESGDKKLDIKERKHSVPKIALENGDCSLDKEVSKLDSKVDNKQETSRVLLSAIHKSYDLPKTYLNLDNEKNSDVINKNVESLTGNSFSDNNLNMEMQKHDNKNITDKIVDSPMGDFIYDDKIQNINVKSVQNDDILKDEATNIKLNNDVVDVLDNINKLSTKSTIKDKILPKSNIQTKRLNHIDISCDILMEDNKIPTEQQTVEDLSINVYDKDVILQKNMTEKLIDTAILNGHDDDEIVKNNIFEYSANDQNDNTTISVKNHNQNIEPSAPNESRVENDNERELNYVELNTNIVTLNCIKNNYNKMAKMDNVIEKKTSEKALNKVSSENITIVTNEEIDNLDSADKNSVLNQKIEKEIMNKRYPYLIDETVPLNQSMEQESIKIIMEESINESKEENSQSPFEIKSTEKDSSIKNKDLYVENTSVYSDNGELSGTRKTRSKTSESMQKDSTIFNEEIINDRNIKNSSLQPKSVKKCDELKKKEFDPETASINSEDSEICLGKLKSKLKTNVRQELKESVIIEPSTILNKEPISNTEETKLYNTLLDTKLIENSNRDLKKKEIDPETASINSEESEISLCRRNSRPKTNNKQVFNDYMKKESGILFDEETINEKKQKNLQNMLRSERKSIEDGCELKRNEFDPETASINSEDSEISYGKRKSRSKTNSRQGSVTMTKALEDPEFQQYLEIRQDALIDENPQLTQEEIVSYLYKTWLYEESIKPEAKKCDGQSLVKGLKQDSVEKPKKVKKKKADKEHLLDADEIIPREKPKRKLAKPFYNYDISDIEDEIESFEIFPINTKDIKKTESEISNKLEEQGTNAIVEVCHEEVSEYEYDEEESYFDELTKPKPNVFKGTIREKVCEICERPSNLIKCKICLDMFHIDCTKKEIKVEDVSTPSRGRKKKKKTRGRRPKGLDDSNGLDSESQSDDKSQDANVSEDLNISFEEAETESHVVVDVDEFESHITNKMKEMLDQNLNFSYDSSDCEVDWNRSVPGKCEIVDIKLKSKNEINASLYPDFKCKNCETYNLPLCFVCKSAVSPKTKAEYRQKCQLSHCNKYFHLECLDHWPQTQLELSENKFEPLTCPRHVCHTCVCDDPRGCKTRFSSDKLARCVRCPATYHCFSKCLPAGTQILTGSHIVCPRHYEHRPGKVPCHVNTGWCFICALGGTLICCEYCPTSFHAECLNIKPPEGSYMCEDCETGRLPLYGEMVWVKLGHYRWWPGIILHPSEIPSNIMAVKHTLGEFVVRFFGQYDHYWVNRGRVFPFQEGDSGKISSQKSKIDEAFTKAMEHAQRACEILKTAEPNSSESQELAQSLLPPQYVKLKCNKPVGRVAARRDDGDHSLTQCECEPGEPDACGPYTSCLNRMLLTECGPSCRAGDRCNNRQFEKRQYPKLVPYRTPHRGWGLKTLEDIKLGQFVIEYVGELISEEEFTRRMRRKHEIRDENFYFLTLDKERMIDAGPKGNLARFMNHCCEPNCETQKWTVLGDVRVGLFAMKDIPANSELTFNYNLESAGIEKKRCLCGAKRCSGYIGAKPKQDESQQKKSKSNIKKPNKKRKLPEELPTTTKCKPKSRQTSRSKPKELTEIEKDLLIIKNATNITSSDSECSERLSVEEKKQKALKRTANDEFQVNSGSKRLKLDKCDRSDFLG